MFTFSQQEVPEEWIYKHYLEFNIPMNGDPIGPFMSIYKEEKTPSLHLYSKEGKYFFKDFSSGKSGNAWDIAKQMEIGNYSTFADLQRLVTHKYINFIKDGGVFTPETVIKDNYKFKVTYDVSDFNETTDSYWLSKYGITRDILYKHNVRSLIRFQLTKEYQDQQYNKVYSQIVGEHIYGYFDEDGQINTIYQPLNTDYKFFKLHSVIYGEDILTYTKDVLIIGSSKKDIMSMDALNIYNVEYIALPNERAILKPEKIVHYKRKYRLVLTLLDNDVTGVEAMKNYYTNHGLPFIYCPYQKDISDFIDKSGQQEAKNFLIYNIQKRLNEQEFNSCLR